MCVGGVSRRTAPVLSDDHHMSVLHAEVGFVLKVSSRNGENKSRTWFDSQATIV